MEDIIIDNPNVQCTQDQRNRNNSNNCIDCRESLPSFTVKKQNTPLSKHKNTNLLETYTSTKIKNGNILDNLHKKIYFLEFLPKTNLNSIEYYLNNTLKNKKFQNNQDGSKVNSFVLPQIGNSTIHNLNNNTLINISSQVEDEIPYNISEHLLPLGEDENIIKILKNNDYFQDQTNDVFNLILSELIYISASQGMKIYDLNDESNYFFIINKGSVNLIKNNKLNEKLY